MGNFGKATAGAAIDQQVRDAAVARAIDATLSEAALATAGTVMRLHGPSSYDTRLMAAASRAGIVDPVNALGAAVYSRVDMSVICTSLLMESYGGRNMWGGDPGGDALPANLFEQPVTKEGWLEYWANVLRGLTVNGCGPGQLTSKSLQVAANKLGGCWLPGPNMKVAAIFMRQLLAETGGSVNLAFQHYNGSGPAAVAYGWKAYEIEDGLHREFQAL